MGRGAGRRSRPGHAGLGRGGIRRATDVGGGAIRTRDGAPLFAARIAADFGVGFVPAAAVGVSPEPRVVFAGGASLRARHCSWSSGRGRWPPSLRRSRSASGCGRAVRELVADLARGAVRRVAFVAPSLAGWVLPLYELALLTARTVAVAGVDDVRLSWSRPSATARRFRGGAERDRGGLLTARGLSSSARPTSTFAPGRWFVRRGARSFAVDRVVALPLVRGPRLGRVEHAPQTSSPSIVTAGCRAAPASTRPATPRTSRSSRAVSLPSRPTRSPRTSRRGTARRSSRHRSSPSCAGCC